MILGLTYYEICKYFLLYSFFGWVLEVVYHAAVKGKIVNRGFLNGPVCPVYGFGALAVLFAAQAIPSGSSTSEAVPLLILFVGGTVICTAIELFAGWLLDVLFHTRWWDYSSRPLNFHGYICLEFSLLWGVAVVLVVRVLHPLLEESSGSLLPENVGWIVMAVLYAVYLADLIVTVLTVLDTNRKLAELDRVRGSMRTVSDAMTEVIGTGSLRTSQAVGKSRVQASLAGAELRDSISEHREELEDRTEQYRQAVRTRADEMRETLQERREEQSEKGDRRRQELESRAEELRTSILKRYRHFLRAYPEMHHDRYQETMQEILERFRGGKK